MHFCLTGQYTPQALNSIMDNPTVSRYEAAKNLIEAAGGKMLALYVTLGEYDFMSIAEFDHDIDGLSSLIVAAGTGLADPIPGRLPRAPFSVSLETVAAGLVSPTYATFAPGVANRLFVTDQPGTPLAVAGGPPLPPPPADVIASFVGEPAAPNRRRSRIGGLYGSGTEGARRSDLAPGGRPVTRADIGPSRS